MSLSGRPSRVYLAGPIRHHPDYKSTVEWRKNAVQEIERLGGKALLPHSMQEPVGGTATPATTLREIVQFDMQQVLGADALVVELYRETPTSVCVLSEGTAGEVTLARGTGRVVVGWCPRQVVVPDETWIAALCDEIVFNLGHACARALARANWDREARLRRAEVAVQRLSEGGGR